MDGATLQQEIADLRSLGVDPKKISEMNNARELKQLAGLLKQSLIEEYKMAYGERGAKYEEETKATSTKF